LSDHLLSGMPQLLQVDLGSIVRQRDPVQHVRLDAPVRPVPEDGRSPELVLSDVQIVTGDGEGVGPIDARVPDEDADSSVGGIVDVDRVLFHTANVDESVGVGLQAVGNAFLSEAVHGGLRHDLRGGAAISEPGGWDAVQVSRCDGGEI
jgi:hypothetical protein